MGGILAVRRLHGPAVRHLLDGGAARVDHRLHGDGHAPQKTGTMAGIAEVGYLRRLVHPSADAVTDILPNDAEAVGFHVSLHRGGNIRQTVALSGILDALEEALLRDSDQPHGLVGHLPAGVGAGAVAMEATDTRAPVHAAAVALLQHPLAGDAVDDLIVDGDAHAGRIAVVVQERGRGTLLRDELEHSLIDLLRCDAGSYHIPCQGTGSRGNFASPAHQLDLVRRF